MIRMIVMSVFISIVHVIVESSHRVTPKPTWRSHFRDFEYFYSR